MSLTQIISVSVMSSSRIAGKVGLLVLALMLCACETVKPFTLQPGEPTARVETVFEEGLQICIDGKVSPLKKDAGHYLVPADKLVTLYTRRVLTRDRNDVNYCETNLSVIPKPGTNYLLNIKVRYLSCELEMLELDQQGKVVTILEPEAVHIQCFSDDYVRKRFSGEYIQ